MYKRINETYESMKTIGSFSQRFVFCCDECGKEYIAMYHLWLLDGNVIPRPKAPEGWFVVSEPGPKHFCCAGCLSDWARSQDEV